MSGANYKGLSSHEDGRIKELDTRNKSNLSTKLHDWKILSILLTIVFVASVVMIIEEGSEVQAEAAEQSGTCGDNLKWTLDKEGTLTISGSGEMYDYVKNLGSTAPWIKYKESLRKLVLEQGVGTIGKHAFYGCSGFSGSLNIPTSVTIIGDDAFYDCSGFSGSLNIPTSVKEIGWGAFRFCTGFTGSLTIPAGIKEIESVTFQGCYGMDGSLNIPSSVKIIGGCAFDGSNFSGTLNLPASVREIGDGAFRDLNFTGTLELPQYLTYIGKGAFSGCKGLTGVEFPPYLTYIGDEAFCNCEELTGSLDIPSGVTYIGDLAFNNCKKLKGTLIIPSTVEEMGEAFSFTNFHEIRFGGGLKSIDERAFFPDTFYDSNGTTRLDVNVENMNGYVYIGDQRNMVRQTDIHFHHVIYDYNGGLPETPMQFDVIEGQSFEIGPCKGIKPGYTFTGWSYAGRTYVPGDYMTMGASDMKLTAIWSDEPAYHVTYDVNGGLSEAPIQLDAVENQRFKAASYNGIKKGYTFAGWSYGGKTYTPGNDIFMGASDMTLTAIWSDEPAYHVTYDVNGGSSKAPEQANVIKEESFVIAPYDGVKTEYIFTGWSYDGKTYVPGDRLTMGTSDITLKAVWESVGPEPGLGQGLNLTLIIGIVVIVVICGVICAFLIMRKKH